MSTKTKKVQAEIQAEEVVRHYRTVVLEVPVDMRDEEVECVAAEGCVVAEGCEEVADTDRLVAVTDHLAVRDHSTEVPLIVAHVSRFGVRVPLSADLRLVVLPLVEQLEVAAQVRCRFHVQVSVEHE